VRYAILGDVHSNLEAFDAVIEALEDETYDEILCTGDIVGYGASPRECIRRLRDLSPTVLVGGNHDWAVSGRFPLDYFNHYAQQAILWTRRSLASEDVEWLGSNPALVRHGDVTVAHGTIHDPESFDYLTSAYDAHLSFASLMTPFAFVGHSHVPVTFFRGTTITYALDDVILLEDGVQALMNVGSVGQPRDEDPRASYGIFDDRTRTLCIMRVRYDVEAAIAHIREAGLPDFLGERLKIGR
jgi:diadenosine tetraphosphatase ApaH/serine/threonine PP2A family protein phosphatase